MPTRTAAKPTDKKATKKKAPTAATTTVKHAPPQAAQISNNNFGRVKALMFSLNKNYKSNVVKTGRDIPPLYKVPFMEPMLDYASDGGFAIGRFIEGIGQEHTGKTRNGLVMMGCFQRYCFNCHSPEALHVEWKPLVNEDDFPEVVNIYCDCCDNPSTKIQVMVDYEGTTDPEFMHNFGVDTNGIIYTRPDLPSTAVDIVDAFMRNPDIGLIMFDSVGGLGSDKEVQNAIVDDKMNQNALFLNKATRKWQAALNSNTNEGGKESGTTLYVVNQSYMTIGVFAHEVVQGGRGLRHGKGMSLKTRVKEKVKASADGPVIGVHITCTNEKNKTGMPYRQVEYYLNLNPDDPIGYCKTNIPLQYVELAIQFGVITQQGGWYYYDGNKWQGKSKLVDSLSAAIMDGNDEGGTAIKVAIDSILYKRPEA